ncbi:E2 protein [Mustela putorius papillomavirus 1]|uniref:Regulatory protein E2 n=1 Tax=Mustela putorius papillomavirus 1 TaxID=2259540 RepID=T1YD17_9PAPI|nr:E2 protein [Mustela putorius papillomavirus 1]AGU62952.1 E2 protein [Mustela putorius papillomavirus 1]
MMENLSRRFDVLQEVIMQHYERGSADLKDQISYWELMRRESVMLYFARKKDIPRLGFTTVPALAVSESNAKNAIMLGLQLKSLLASPYGSEPWTMSDTSLELYLCPPKGCFKKSGHSVTVWFDNKADNEFPYTAWGAIYYQNFNDEWKKAEGQCDYDGLFYTDEEGLRHYYVRFGKDAPRFGCTGVWKVNYKNTVISSSVSSSGTFWNSSSTTSPPQWPQWSRTWEAAGSSTTPDSSASTSDTTVGTSSDGCRGRRERTWSTGSGRRGGRGSRGRSEFFQCPGPASMQVHLCDIRQQQEAQEGGSGGCSPQEGQRPGEGEGEGQGWGEGEGEGQGEGKGEGEGEGEEQGEGEGEEQQQREQSFSHAGQYTPTWNGPILSPIARCSGRGGWTTRGGRGACSPCRSTPSTPSYSSTSTSSPATYASDKRGRGGRGRGGRGGRGRGLGNRGRKSGGPPPRLSPCVSYANLGGRFRSVTGQDQWGAGQVKENSGSSPEVTPIIVFRGPGNGLKCWRLRLRRKHHKYFCVASTGFSWCGDGEGNSRIGRPRMIVTFASIAQRQTFLENVKVPRGVELSLGSLDAM